MAFLPHIRMTALGKLGNSGDVFSWGLNLGGPAGSESLPATNSSNASLFAALAARVKTFHGAAATKISAKAELLTVKFALIQPDGSYFSSPYVVDVVDQQGYVAMGDVGGTYVRNENALAVSLTTSSRSATGKGRFYVPMPVIPVDNLNRISQTNAESVLGSAVTLLNGINADLATPQPGVKVIVASNTGVSRYVTGVKVGDVLDTIRSRRNKVIETYYGPTALA